MTVVCGLNNWVIAHLVYGEKQDCLEYGNVELYQHNIQFYAQIYNNLGNYMTKHRQWLVSNVKQKITEMKRKM